MAIKQVQEFGRSGKVFSGDRLISSVTYTITKRQKFLDSLTLTSTGPVGNMPEFTLEIEGHSPPMPESGLGMFLLELEDGRHLKFAYQNGVCRISGGVY